MKVAFGRWLPALARSVAAITHTPVPQRAILVATGLTVAAALTGGQLVAGSTGAPDPARSPVAVDAVIGAAEPTNMPTKAGTPADSGTDQPANAGSDKAAPDKAAPSVEALIPYGTQGPQSRISLTEEQIDNARSIVVTARKLGMPERAAVIGVATSLQESKLQNLGHLGGANDHDSLGLFQQRPSTGWGTPDQVTDPEYASTAFYAGLRNVPDWQRLPLTQAAQAVQVSAYPFAYAQWERQAAEIVQDVWVD